MNQLFMDEEELLISKPDVYLYEIPSGEVESKSDHRAADWDIANPIWQGKILIYMVDPCCHLQLDDQTGNIYGQAVLEEFPGKTLKPVIDSKRYFTLTVQDVEGDFRLVGIGFASREDSSEFSSILKGYFGAAVSGKRKLDQSTNKVSDASPPKIVKTQVLESIFSQTIDPDYKYMVGDRFQCHDCPMNFNHSELMVQHWLKIHNRKKAGVCMECELPFPYKGERNAHLAKFHKKTFPCLVCGKPFSTEGNSIEHFLKVHKRGVDAGPTDSTLDERRTVDPYVESNLVQLIFSRTNDPDYKYKEGQRFQCHECPLRFNCPKLIVHHWSKTHDLRKARACKVCKLPYPFKRERSKHLEKFHTNAFSRTLSKIRLDTGQQVFEDLQNVVKLDTDGKPGVQKINNRVENNSSEASSALDKYHKLDPNVKPNSLESIFSQTTDPKYKYKEGNRFQCHECSRNFKYAESIIQHWSKSHKRKKACMCICKLPFPNIGDKNVHFGKFHQDASFCLICRTPFHTEQEIDEHLLNVHQLVADEKPIDPIKSEQTTIMEDSGIAQINNNGTNNTSEPSETGIELPHLESSVEPVDKNGGPGKLNLMPPRTCKICGDIIATNKEHCDHHRFHMKTAEGVKAEIKTEIQ